MNIHRSDLALGIRKASVHAARDVLFVSIKTDARESVKLVRLAPGVGIREYRWDNVNGRL